MNFINGLFYISAVAMVINLLSIFFIRQSIKLGLVLILNSLLWLLATGTTLIYLGFIVDEFNLSGNPLHTILVFVNGALFIATLIVFGFRWGRS